MSYRSLLNFDDRYSPDRYWQDHRYTTATAPRHYGQYGHRYWSPHYYNNHYRYNHGYSNDVGTLRFNSLRTDTPTRVYYPESPVYTAPAYTPAVWTIPPKATELKIERMPLQRSNSFVSIVESKDEKRDSSRHYDVKYDYKYVEANDNKSVTSKIMSKSLSNMGSFDACVVPVQNSVTYVYDDDKDKHRHVSFVKHTHDDDGESLAGNLVKSSETFLPVTRSVNVGPIFNGNSFGILSEHLTIRDTFHVAFQFKTTQQNGVLMSIVDRSSGDAFFIELYDSQLKATLFVDGEADSCWTDFTKPVLSNDIWSDVEVNILNNRMSMTVRNEIFTKTHRFPFRRPIRGDLFVAGFPSTATPPFVCRSKDFFVGEMRNFYLNNDGVKWYGTPSYVNPRLRNWYH